VLKGVGMADERNYVTVVMQCREVGWNALPTLKELRYVAREGVSEDAHYTVLGEGIGKREAAGKKMKVVLLVEKSENEEHSNDDNFVSGTLHRTTIPVSLSNEGEGDGGRQKDVAAAKRVEARPTRRTSWFLRTARSGQKKTPRLIKALGRKKYLELLLKGKNGIPPKVISVILSCIFSCILHVQC
jgi:hypothetical protein